MSLLEVALRYGVETGAAIFISAFGALDFAYSNTKLTPRRLASMAACTLLKILALK